MGNSQYREATTIGENRKGRFKIQESITFHLIGHITKVKNPRNNCAPLMTLNFRNTPLQFIGYLLFIQTLIKPL